MLLDGYSTPNNRKHFSTSLAMHFWELNKQNPLITAGAFYDGCIYAILPLLSSAEKEIRENVFDYDDNPIVPVTKYIGKDIFYNDLITIKNTLEELKFSSREDTELGNDFITLLREKFGIGIENINIVPDLSKLDVLINCVDQVHIGEANNFKKCIKSNINAEDSVKEVQANAAGIINQLIWLYISMIKEIESDVYFYFNTLFNYPYQDDDSICTWDLSHVSNNKLYFEYRLTYSSKGYVGVEIQDLVKMLSDLYLVLPKKIVKSIIEDNRAYFESDILITANAPMKKPKQLTEDEEIKNYCLKFLKSKLYPPRFK